MVKDLSKRYLGHINCARFTPNKERIEDIKRLASEFKADGVIGVNLKFSNLYGHGRILCGTYDEEAGIPCLCIETDLIKRSSSFYHDAGFSVQRDNIACF